MSGELEPVKSALHANLTGRVVVVTGGAKGIGRTLSEAFAAAGAQVVVADLAQAEASARQVSARGACALGVTVDVADPPGVRAMVAAAVERFGRVDVLVNNAGIFSTLKFGVLTDITPEAWRRLFDVNVLGTFLCTQAVVPVMQAQRAGAIINMASNTPYRGVPGVAHYVASKGAIIALTRALARELGSYGIRVNAIAPGFTLSEGILENSDTLAKVRERTRVERALVRDQVPEDIVGPALFLASAAAAFMTGQTVVVDGGVYFT